MMTKYIIILLISKGQQQTTLQQHHQQQQQQQQLSSLFKPPIPQRLTVHIQQQHIHEQKPLTQTGAGEQSYYSITFPSSNEDPIGNEHLSSPINNPNFNNLIAPTTSHRVSEPTNISPSLQSKPPAPAFAASVDNISPNFQSKPPSPAFAASGDNEYDFIREFAWTLFQGSKIPAQNGNLILSPLLVQMQLSLLRKAATGLTEEEIGHAIHETHPDVTRRLSSQLRSTNSLSTNLEMASAIFTANNLRLNNTFIQEAIDRHIGIIPVDFSSSDASDFIINSWVSNATNNKIRNIFKPDPRQSIRTLLANTIYFNGEWKFGFNEIKFEPFYTNEQLVKSVEMMKNIASMRAGKIILRNGFSGQWVELPYRGDEYSMVLIIPQQRFYLDEFIRSIRANDFNDIMNNLTTSYKKMVHLSVPKFSAVSSFSVVNVLLKMGIVDLFTQNSRLPYLAENEPSLRIDEILQQGLLSIDEKGTIAAAATVSHVVTLSLNSGPEEVYFKADQPFLSIVVDKRNKIPIFISKIYNP